MVIDASAAVVLALHEGAFERLPELSAPCLLWSEAATALRKQLWRREISADAAAQAFGVVLGAPIEAVPPPSLQRLAWDVAEELGWAKIYDAEYVALARSRGCPLLTVDLRLQRRVGHLVQVLGLADL